jgi:hypothetical protein
VASVVARTELQAIAWAGEPWKVRLVLRPRDETDEIGVQLDGVTLTLHARARSFEGKWLEDLMRLERTIAGETIVPPSGATFEATFDVPSDAPPTYDNGSIFGVQWTLELHARAPWWRSLNETWEVRVARRPSARAAPVPSVAVFPTFDRPFLEVALDDAVFAPGESVTGAFAVGNVKRAQYVELCLVTRETIRHGVFQTFEGQRHVLYRDLIGVDEGQTNPFHVPIPVDVPPRFTATGAILEWKLEASIDGARSGDACRLLPLIIEALDGTREATHVECPSIGRARWVELWRSVASARGWTSKGETRIERAFETCNAAVFPAGNGGIGVELGWTDWELGLERAPLDDVEGRERDQSRAMLSMLDASLRVFHTIEISDTGATLGVDASPWDGVWLDDTLAKIESLAEAITHATNAMPPPNAMTRHIDAWRDAQRTLGGRLCVGSMSLRDLSVEGARAAIETRFDHKHHAPFATHVVVLTEGRLPKTLVGVPQRLGDRAVSVEDEALVLRLDEVTSDPASLRALLVDLVALLHQLGSDGVHGPYR